MLQSFFAGLPLIARACGATCLQLAKADAASAAHPLVNQLRCAIQCHRGTGTSPPPLHPLQCQPPIVLASRDLPWHCWREYPPRHEHTTTIPGWPANDPRQHARQRRADARRVLLAVPPPGDLERRPARSAGHRLARQEHLGNGWLLGRTSIRASPR
jgi:hypothetical protein